MCCFLVMEKCLGVSSPSALIAFNRVSNMKRSKPYVCEYLLRECRHRTGCVGENVRARACLFSSLSAGVIVRGLCWPGGLPSAIFIVGNVGAVMSNWEPTG